MRRFRLTVGWLMALVLLAGTGFAALRDASNLLAEIGLATTAVVLALAMFGAIVRRGPRRAFALGFVAFGGGYLALAVLPWSSTVVAPRLPTTRLLDRVYPSVSRPRHDRTLLPRARFDESYSAWAHANPSARNERLVFTAPGVDPSDVLLTWEVPNRDAFRTIGHCLWALMIALAGGLAAQTIVAGRVPSRSSPHER